MGSFKENFVDIIGFQHERVHTGILAWVFDSDLSPFSISEITSVLSEISGVDLFKFDPEEIKTHTEYGWGRGKKIDLVIELYGSQKDPPYHLLIELKTDSDVNVSQLVDFEDLFKGSDEKSIGYSIGVVALGSGQVTIPGKKEKRLKGKNYFYGDVSAILHSFTPLKEKGSRSWIFSQWIQSLNDEMEKLGSVLDLIGGLEGPFDQEGIEKIGLRNPRVLFYYYYNALREEMGEFGKEWAIHSGNNNTVMNWWDGWVNLDETNEIEVYLEFDWNELKVKAEIWGEEDRERKWDRWQKLRKEKVVPVVQELGMERAQNRKGWHVSVGKKKFKIHERPIKDVADEVRYIADRFKKHFRS